MSLADAVTEITNDLEKHIGCSVEINWVGPYIKMLRMAVKAAETTTSVQPEYQQGLGGWELGQQWQAKARAEFAGKKELLEEAAAEQHIQIMDGPYQGDLFPIIGPVPLGANIHVNEAVYQLLANGLWHCPVLRQEASSGE